MIVDTLKIQFLNLKHLAQQQNLPIYGIEAKNLIAYEKSAADVKKGILSKEPDDF